MREPSRFDREASVWDQVDRRTALARGVAEAIQARIPLSKAWSMLDFGCGTGLVSLALEPHVGAVTGVDSSQAMLDVLGEKAHQVGRAVRLLRREAHGEAGFGGPYDLIVSSMTLHHIPDVPAFLRRLAGELRPGGWVALADLDLEDGRFHSDHTGVYHSGFSREQMEAWLGAVGFRDVVLETATSVSKEGAIYPVFLASARMA